MACFSQGLPVPVPMGTDILGHLRAFHTILRTVILTCSLPQSDLKGLQRLSEKGPAWLKSGPYMEPAQEEGQAWSSRVSPSISHLWTHATS